MDFKPGDRVTLSHYTVHNLTDSCSIEISPHVVGRAVSLEAYSKIKVEFEIIHGVKICFNVFAELLTKVSG